MFIIAVSKRLHKQAAEPTKPIG